MPGPHRHSMTHRHRSTDDSTGANIAAGYAPLAQGDGTVAWQEIIDSALEAIVTGLQAHGNLGATETFSADTGTHTGTLDANCTFTLTDFAAGESRAMALWLTQDGTGGRTITLPAAVVNKAELEAAQDTTAGTTSILVLWSVDGGTSIVGGWWGQSETIDYGEDGDISDLAFDDVADAGVLDEAARADHVHGMPSEPTSVGIGPILISDTPSTPLVFADLIQNEAQDDLVYSDP